MAMPEWLEKAEKFEEKPADGRQYRVVVHAGKSWYVPLSQDEIGQRAADLAKKNAKLLAAWAKYDAWDDMTVEEKLELLRPAPPRGKRPA